MKSVIVSYGNLKRHPKERVQGEVLPAYTSRTVHFSNRENLFYLEQAFRDLGLDVLPATILPSRSTIILDPPPLGQLPKTINLQ